MTRPISGDVSDHRAILEAFERGMSLVDTLGRDHLHPRKSGSMYDRDILKFFQFQCVQLRTAVELTSEAHYLESLTLNRSTFEHYLWLLLASRGFRYKTEVRTPPHSEGSADEELEKWGAYASRDDTHAERAYRPNQSPERICIVWRGLFPEGQPQRGPIPLYYLLAKHYDSAMAYLSQLPTLQGNRRYSAREREEWRREHRGIYREYLSFAGLIDWLKLNELLDDAKADRARVHYNFLSLFAHNQYRALDCVEGRIKRAPSIQSIGELLRYDHHISELALLYSIKLLEYLVDLVLHHPCESYDIRPRRPYENYLADVRESFCYFWFLYEDPFEYDLHMRETELEMARRKGSITDGDTPFYYDNPLSRLRGLHISQIEGTTGRRYASPFDSEST